MNNIMKNTKKATDTGELITHRPIDISFIDKVYIKTKSNKYGKIIIYLSYIIYSVISFNLLILILIL